MSRICRVHATQYYIWIPGSRVLSRKLFKNELEEKWPKPEDFVDWDIWMRANHNRKGRECIIPDISRTYHFGGKGLNVGGHMQARYFAKHSLNTKPNVKLDVDKMYKENYEKEINQLLRWAVSSASFEHLFNQPRFQYFPHVNREKSWKRGYCLMSLFCLVPFFETFYA